ncbi:hypothetical protein A2U01_0102735, partial [Trifolium medium]|nr:hypothetical protein [Trifolium medium]
VSSVDLDSRYSKKENKEEKKLRKEKEELVEATKEIPHPRRGVKIGTGLPDLVRKQLKACLRENADLFAWSAAEM